MTFKVIQALQRLTLMQLEAVVVVGGSNPHYEMLQKATHHSPFPIHLKRNVTNMPELMAWADIAVSAGGTTCWEMAFMGLPNIILVLADNQVPIAEKLDKAGLALNLGWHETVIPDEIAEKLSDLLDGEVKLQEMSNRGRQLVDGEGNCRILGELKNFFVAK